MLPFIVYVFTIYFVDTFIKIGISLYLPIKKIAEYTRV